MAIELIKNPFITEDDWNWVQFAEKLKTLSKDPSRKVGCVFVKDGEVISQGINKLPLETLNTSFRLRDQSVKNLSIIHAEMAAISLAASKGIAVKGSTAFVTCHPCATCASILIDAGIERVVCPGFLQSYSGKWLESFRLASEDLKSAGVTVLYYGKLND